MKSLTSFVYKTLTALMIVALALTAMPVTPAYAAVSQQAAWSSRYANTAYPAGSLGNYAIAAGTDRLLVVAISSTRTTAGNQTVSNVTYGGQALTLAQGDAASTGTWNHTYLYYLNNAGINAAVGTSLNVTIAGGTSHYTWVYAAVFVGVDQTTPVTNARNFNSNVVANDIVGPFNPTLNVDAGDQAIEIVNLSRSATGNAIRDIDNWAANWGNNGGAINVDIAYDPGGTNIKPHTYITTRAVPGANTNDGSQHSANSNDTWDSMTAMTMNAAPSTNIGDGTSPSNKSVIGSETNRAVSAFTLSTSVGTDTVSNLVVTGTNTANVAGSGVKIYRDTGGTANEWDATDTLVGTASFAGATATFTGINLAVNTTTTQYIITYDIVAAPTNGQTMTAFVSGATTTTLPLTNNDNADATITVDSVAPTVSFVSSPNGAAAYGIGATIDVRVIFNENVTVTGTPQLTLETGTVDRVINYASGSGSTTIYFTYTVQEGDVSPDLDYVSVNSLALNGGTIRDGAGNNATLTLPTPGGPNSLSANEGLEIDGIRPTVTINQAATQADPANSQPVNFTVEFNGPIDVSRFTASDITLSGTSGTSASGVFTGANINITDLGSNRYNVAVSNLSIAGTVTATIDVGRIYDDAGNGNTAPSTSTDNTVTLQGFTITASAGPGGTITPNGVLNVVGGASVAFASVPSTGYLLSDLLVSPPTPASSVGTINNYTLNNITTNRTIAASFEGGWSAPASSANNGCGNDVANAYTSNNSYTTCGSGESGVYSNFNINIPAGSTINYVEVGLEGYTDGRNLQVSISDNGGANFGNVLLTTYAAEPATPNRTMRIGNRPGDDWQVPFTPASFSNTNFRVQITGAGGGNTFYLDQLQVKVNYTLPPVTINQAAGQLDPTNTFPINFTVVFPYPVTNFATGDVTLGGTATGALIGTVTQIAPNNGTTYNVAVSGMTGNGTVIASIAAGVATDANGRPNTPSTSTDNIVTYDATAPTAVIDLQEASDTGISNTDNLTNAASPIFDVTFSEDVSGLVSGDFSNTGTATGCTFTVGALSGNTYPLTVSGCSQGTLIVRLAAGAVTDASGSPNAQTNGPTVTIDRTGPSVTINQLPVPPAVPNQPDPTGVSPINFTAVFSESVSDFTGLDVTLSGTANPTVANVTGGPATYNVAVSNMTTSGPGLTVIASIGAGVATDAAGNPNIASTSTDNSVVYNSNAPIASINLQSASDSGISNADNVTNAADPVFDVSFDEPVNVLDNTDFSNMGTATGCTFAVGMPTGNSYPVTVSGCSEGTLILRLAGGAVTNIAAVANAQTTGPTVTIDRTRPSVTINQAGSQNDPTNVFPIDFTVEFNEAVAGFATGDVSFTGSTVGGTLTGAVTEIAPNNDTTYNVAVSGMTSSGNVVATIAAGAATDLAGNISTASTSGDNVVTYDTVAPTVTINQLPLPPAVPNQPDPTNASPINFIVVFSEPVTGFATGDVTLSGTAGATTATVTPVNTTTYNVAVGSMTGSGTVIANIAAGVATDLAGNDNIASTSGDNQVTYDITRPTVTVEQAPPPQTDPTNLSPIRFTVEFSKPVTGFAAADVILSSGTATVIPVSTTLYTISVTGMVQGPLTASIAAGMAIDSVGNTNTASTSVDNIVIYDTIAPTVTVSQAVGQTDPTNVSPIHFTATFSEAVSGFDGTDVTLSSGTATVTPVSATVYDISVAGMAQGVLTAAIPAGRATDQTGIANAASTSTDNSVLYDTLAPSVTVEQEATQPDPTNTGPINFTVVFSEPVADFTNADLVGNFGGTAAPTTAAITTGSGTTYNVAISGMAADGTVTLTLPANIAQDVTGNSNTASASADNVVTYDTTRPTVTINQAAAQADPTSVSPINFTVVFSEPVTGLASADINLTGTAGATTATVTPVNTTTYNVEVSGMTASGTVIPFVFVNAAQDAAGNSSFASTSLDNTVTFDNAALTVTINQDGGQSDPTGAAQINFAVIFNKLINSATFTGADVNLTGGTAPGTLTAVVTGSGTTYNVAVSGMTGSGTVIATIPAGGIQDTAGNNNTVSTSVDNTVTFDATAPTVMVNQAAAQADPTNGMPINFAVLFSEAMTGFATGDVTFTGSTAGGTLVGTVTGGGTTYNVAVTGMTSSGLVIVTIPASVATDGTGNGNAASTSTDNTVTYDVTAPTVTINQAVGQADPTGASPINFDVIFSESVSNFVTGDVTLSGAAGATTAVVSGGGTTYTVAVSGMSGPGDVIASILAGKATDGAGNTNIVSTSTDNTVTFDSGVLSVTINQKTSAPAQADPTNAGPINFTVVFNKPVTDFTNADVVLSGLPAGPLTVTVTQLPPNDGTTYNVAVSGLTISRTVIATIPANAAHDTAGNGNANSTFTDNTVTYDVTPPTVTINQATGQPDPTNASPINFTVVFNEPVTGFATGDVTFTGSTAGGTFTGTVTEIAPNNGTTYTVAVTGMTSNGTVVASLLAGVATDAAGNASAVSASTDNTVTFDNAALTVTINQAAGQADPTNVRPINFTVVFSKPVNGFAAADVVLIAPAGGTATVSGPSGGTTYNVSVTGMTTSGAVTASILAGAAQDASGTSSAASVSTDNTVIYDVTLPTVTINQAVGQADPTNAGPINFTVVFSELVTGFTTTDVALSGAPGTLTGTVTLVSGNTYNVAVNGMTGSGTVVATIAAGGVQDSAGNGNTNSTSADNAVTYDVTPPTVTINQAIGQTDPTNASPIVFEVVFSKPVTGFIDTDITLSGSALATTAIVTGGGANYTVAVSGMTADGIVTVSIAAGVATDAVGNTNTASTSTDDTVSFGLTVPTVTINQAAGQQDPTGVSPINFTVIFSKVVTGFTGTDVTVGGTALGTKTALVTGIGTTYNVAVSGMTSSGTVIPTIPAGAAQDATGNTNTASSSTDNIVTHDITAPTVTINQAIGQADPSNSSPINFTVVFSEPVTGFTGADVALSGSALATTANVTGGPTNYTVAVSGMTASGTVIASIPAGNAQDSAANGNAASTSIDNIVAYDSTAPSVTINQAVTQADPTNASPIIFEVVFTKPVTGFTGADVTLGGSALAATAVVSGTGATYSVEVSGMTADGTVIVSIPAGVATDSVGNTNAASTSTDNTVTYDRTDPTVTINQAAAQQDPTGVSPINFTVVFSEPVTGFALADLNLGGTAGATTMVLSGSGANYNVAVSGMAGSGTVFVTITDAAGIDAAGNPSAASTSSDNSVRYDTGAPTVTINQAASQADPTSASPIIFTVIFSKPVTGFIGADVNVTGTAGATTVLVAGGGTTYTVEVSGMADTGTVIANIPADRAQDSAGNGNIASTSTDNTVTYDVSVPSVTIDQAASQGDPTNTSPINFAVVFSETVTGFTSADVTLGGTAGATNAVVSGSGATYNVAVSGMVTDGTITATIGAAVVVDGSGNGNAASTSTDNEVGYSTTNPTVTIDQSLVQVDPANISPINFTVVFSKLVTGFTDSDITIGGTAGATTAAVTGSGLTYNVAVSGMTGDGTVIVSIHGGAATDLSGNPNIASTSTDNTVMYFDTQGPKVVTVNTTPNTGGNDILAPSEKVTVNLTLLKVKFSQEVYNPAGDSDSDDVTNPNNYMLIRDLGDTAGFQTASCSPGADVPADTKIAIGTVTYDAATSTATFAFNGSLPLSNGSYRLFVCGTTSIVDPIDNTLGLVGSSGGANSDYVLPFTVNITSGGGNTGGGGEGKAGTGKKDAANEAPNNVLIPVTGFAPGQVTRLPIQPADQTYRALDEIRIEIPTLGINFPIVGVTLSGDQWNLTWLKDSVGYLEGSAYPTFNGNSVLTAHVIDANNNLGPFSDIKGMRMNDRIYLHAYGKIYIYQVQENRKLSPANISTVFKHEEYSWVTLVTCEDYDAKSKEYKYRRMVRAVLISVVPEE